MTLLFIDVNNTKIGIATFIICFVNNCTIAAASLIIFGIDNINIIIVFVNQNTITTTITARLTTRYIKCYLCGPISFQFYIGGQRRQCGEIEEIYGAWCQRRDLRYFLQAFGISLGSHIQKNTGDTISGSIFQRGYKRSIWFDTNDDSSEASFGGRRHNVGCGSS